MKRYELVGTNIMFPDNKIVTVLEVLGAGNTCIGYKCKITYNDNTFGYGVLKEFLPNGFDYKTSNIKYKYVLPSQWDDFIARYIDYLNGLGSIRNILKSIETPSLKRYFTVPPNIKLDQFDENGDFKSINYNALFYFSPRENTFYGLSLYAFDSIDISSKICEFNIKERIEILSKLCLVIDKFHEKDIILADIKPENFLYEKDDIGGFCLKLFDFDSILKLDKNGKLLPNQTISGTNYFSAPEIFTYSSLIGKKSDVYSIGALLLYFVFREQFDELIDITKIFSKKDLKHIKDIFNNETFEKLLNCNNDYFEKHKGKYYPITTGFFYKLKNIILKAMNPNTTQRYGYFNGKSPMQNLHDDLIVLNEIYENKGVHPEVMLNNAIKDVQNNEQYSQENFDPDLFTEIEVVND